MQIPEKKFLSAETPIESGILFQNGRKQDSAGVQYELRILDKKYLPKIMELQQIVIDNLLRKDTLQPFSAGFMEEHLERKGFVLGVISGKDLLAFRNVYFPDIDDTEWNLGIDLGFPFGTLNKVANLQMVCVHPSYRGNSIAAAMNRHAVRLIRELGIHCHVCATVSPYNFWNIRVLLNSGFIIKKLTRKYGGKLRYIVHNDLYSPVSLEPDCFQSVVLTDFVKQQEILNSGWLGTNLTVSREDAGRPFYDNMLLTFSRLKKPLGRV